MHQFTSFLNEFAARISNYEYEANFNLQEIWNFITYSHFSNINRDLEIVTLLEELAITGTELDLHEFQQQVISLIEINVASKSFISEINVIFGTAYPEEFELLNYENPTNTDWGSHEMDLEGLSNNELETLIFQLGHELNRLITAYNPEDYWEEIDTLEHYLDQVVALLGYFPDGLNIENSQLRKSEIRLVPDPRYSIATEDLPNQVSNIESERNYRELFRNLRQVQTTITLTGDQTNKTKNN